MTDWQKGIPTEDGNYVFRILNTNIHEEYFFIVEKRDSRWWFKGSHARWVIPECFVLGWIKLPKRLPNDYEDAVCADFMMTEQERERYREECENTRYEVVEAE